MERWSIASSWPREKKRKSDQKEDMTEIVIKKKKKGRYDEDSSSSEISIQLIPFSGFGSTEDIYWSSCGGHKMYDYDGFGRHDVSESKES